MKKRIAIFIQGTVQGVGFRPFIYRLARSYNLKGWVLNSPEGVMIEAEGNKSDLKNFLISIGQEKPDISFISSLEFKYLDLKDYDDFVIKKSENHSEPTVRIIPDIATCSKCRDEIFNPDDRRYLYPFTNCTNCGPRFSIIASLPYDRQNTTMKKFSMCSECRSEYENTENRRFHAQPNACPVCGPHIELWDSSKKILNKNIDAAAECVEFIKKGNIIALKGLGGFQLIADARNDDAIKLLRKRKYREEKPFAVMYPDIQMVKNDCDVSPLEERLLNSAQCPIVLLFAKDNDVSKFVAPGNPYLGVMIPYTPLHHILMKELGFPVIATSGNLSEEPICIDENEAISKLGNIADYFLVHNRPIERHVDDSIVRVINDRELILRRARGYAPLSVDIESNTKMLAVGGHLKNTIAVTGNKKFFLSQHIGNLGTPESYNTFQNTIEDFKRLYKTQPDCIICDMHPDYLSAKYSVKQSIEVKKIQHHIAHTFSCMFDNETEPPLLGVSWDGTGYGEDGKIWGGEFFIFDENGISRKAHFKYFKLPGGEICIKKINRIAFSLLNETGSDDSEKSDNLLSLNSKEKNLLREMLKRKINSPETSSVGRLFDGVAAVLGLRNQVNFEGQAAMELEFLTVNSDNDDYYDYKIENSKSTLIIDWRPIIDKIITEKINKLSLNSISVKFHNTLARIILDISKICGLKKVLLSGGCFQNKYLLEKTIKLLEQNNFKPYWHQRIPPNDGGISAGQAFSLIKS
ncbi:MAG: carbamoyltransferase HypF [Ignavibacteria bacterium]|nr:carbamoyltransferase HypF [Ignavibacteria bacterium]